MTPTSASCPRADDAGGFTLLELLIVLAIIASAAALVVPRLQATHDAIVGSGERADVRRTVERLPLLAREAGKPIVIPAGTAAEAALGTYLTLPVGWRVAPLGPIHVHASGVCNEARVVVSGRGTRETWRLTAPLCSVDDGPAR